MAGNTTNFALANLKNIYVLSTSIHSDYGRKTLQWHFLIRKKNDKEYFEFFTNKEVHWFDGSKLVFGILGEYHNQCEIRFEKLTQLGDFSNRFKGMDIESYAALSEFINYINIMTSVASSNPDIAFELQK